MKKSFAFLISPIMIFFLLSCAAPLPDDEDHQDIDDEECCVECHQKDEPDMPKPKHDYDQTKSCVECHKPTRSQNSKESGD